MKHIDRDVSLFVHQNDPHGLLRFIQLHPLAAWCRLPTDELALEWLLASNIPLDKATLAAAVAAGDINSISRDGSPFIDNIITDACYNCNTAPLISLLRAGVSVDAASDDGVTLLMVACCSSLVVTKILLCEGSLVDARDARGWTPLMYAVCLDSSWGGLSESDSYYIVSELLAAGAEVGLRNTLGHTALDIALMQIESDASRAIVQLLLHHSQAED